MGRYVSVSGVVIALIGFVLTRFTVGLAATDTATEFLFSGIAPLLVGLALTAFGVVLTVGNYEETFVRTIAVWCGIGVVVMFVFVAFTVLGNDPAAMNSPEALREQAFLSNFLIGGAIGGALTGVYAARNRQHRANLTRQANRLILLNRLLRDRVINAAAVIRGHADTLDESGGDAVGVIAEQAEAVVATVDSVKYLAETADLSGELSGSVDLRTCLDSALEEVRAEYPDAEYAVEYPSEPIEVTANARLSEAFRHLLENAVVYAETDPPRVDVSFEATRRTATVSIGDTGPGLPPEQRGLLEEGHIAEFDDPSTGFGLNIVRLLVENFGGDIETSVTGAGSTVEVELPRSGGGAAGLTAERGTLTPPRVERSRLALAVCAGLVAGVTMGAAFELVGELIPTIGALYGIENPVVGWITHEFHSVVFALVYAGVLSTIPLEYAVSARNRLATGVALGVALWVGAAGVIMPAWLLLLGIDTPFPNLTLASLAAHVTWGLTAGTVYHVGDRWLRERERQTALP